MSTHEKVISIFTAPKPFRGVAAVAQERAIASWLQLAGCDVYLVGDEYGIKEAAKRYGVQHLPEVERNDHGTPLISSIFRVAEHASHAPVLCYVNADIILMSDFRRAVAAVPFSHFLMVGRRWNIDPQHVPDLDSPGWEEELRRRVAAHGRLFDPSGIDYFAYTRGLWPAIPRFAVGRPMWDNWMIYSAHASHAAVLDSTDAVMAVHQNHDYSHYPGGVMKLWTGPEAQRNRVLAGGYRHAFTTEDATWLLVRTREELMVKRQPAWRRVLRVVAHYPVVGTAMITVTNMVRNWRSGH